MLPGWGWRSTSPTTPCWAYDTVLATVARRDRLDAAITAMAADSEFTVVTRLGCLRGVSARGGGAGTLAAGPGDPHRWPEGTGSPPG
jgi:transposase